MNSLMRFLENLLYWLGLWTKPKLRCDRTVWRQGVRELRARTGGRIESGAFLLGRERDGIRTISEFLFYDDVDPDCFKHGIVEFNGRLLGKVWAICRAKDLAVVADVHVHPGGFGQSESDMHNPMIAQTGHFALILPDFARGECLPGTVGVYEYQGERQWKSHSRAKGFFEVK